MVFTLQRYIKMKQYDKKSKMRIEGFIRIKF